MIHQHENTAALACNHAISQAAAALNNLENAASEYCRALDTRDKKAVAKYARQLLCRTSYGDQHKRNAQEYADEACKAADEFTAVQGLFPVAIHPREVALAAVHYSDVAASASYEIHKFYAAVERLAGKQ